ncbi:glycosyltransferase [Bacillus salacetis]|uniref:4,4'-diaponeurosporenoate glycosyltransferase n=1 Tax=Bacillus salacetis TaxID=2315464 RepID=A0A3A1QXP3_9BACI|nr:glycosyltransferase family 2 protein [Bacillus salacetis]RIW33598.1 glycosyltransferase [Bacillus salacetis]
MLVILLIINIIGWLILSCDIYWGLRTIDRLEKVPAEYHGPFLSIIVPARNEAHTIGRSLLTQLKLKYNNIEWIIVNDRSTDETRQEIERIAKMDDRIKTLHLNELPEGWLGKNHALYQGYLHSEGDLLLFTDADVHFHPDSVSKAVKALQNEKADHLTAAPSLTAQGFWLQTFIAFFLFGFTYYKRPWKANDQNSRIGMGIGAFNLMTRSGYETIGTHESLRNRPDDDLQLGAKVKEHGLEQRMVTAIGLLSVEWYPTLRSALQGLEKNTFAGLYYRYSMVILAVAGVFFSQVFPFLALLSSDTAVRLLSLTVITLIFFSYFIVIKKMTDFHAGLFFVLPVTALIFIFSIIRAVALTFLRGGVIWRGTKYSLKELRRKIGE